MTSYAWRWVGAACAWVGCIPYGDAAAVPTPPLPVPSEYSEARASRDATLRTASAGAREQRWWLAFRDAALHELEGRALGNSFEVKAAMARIAEAEAMARQAASARFPQLVPEGEASWRRSSVGPFGQVTTYVARASAPVSYEVDWFAKNEGRAQAAAYDVRAARADTGAVEMTLSANVAEAWYDLVEARARTQLLQDQVALNETYLRLTLMRFRRGLVPALDVHQQREQSALTRAELDTARANVRVFENRLMVLLGTMPGEDQVLPSRHDLPPLAEVPHAGMPAALLRSRPDVRAAMQRVRAADERVAVAIANHLPSLLLSASVGYAYQKQNYGAMERLTDGPTADFAEALPETTHGPEYSAGANLTIPLFDGLQRKGEIDRRRAQLRSVVAEYAQTLQRAVAEVENSLAQEAEQRARIAHLEERLEAAEDALEHVRDRYILGLSDYLNVLSALQSQQEAELMLLTAQRQILSFRIQLHRALGGTWTS